MKIASIPANPSSEQLWRYVVKALDAGDFSGLGRLLERNQASLVHLLIANGEPKEYMDEAFAWACMLGRTNDAEFLLERGVDPCEGDKTGQTGFHYAAMGGHHDTIMLLIERKVPMEVKNRYDGDGSGTGVVVRSQRT